MNLSDHIPPAEIHQLEVDLEFDIDAFLELAAVAEDAEDRRFRRKAWTVVGCVLAAFWIGVAGVAWGAL